MIIKKIDWDKLFDQPQLQQPEPLEAQQSLSEKRQQKENWTDVEKINYMAKKNPALLKLKETFDLQILNK